MSFWKNVRFVTQNLKNYKIFISLMVYLDFSAMNKKPWIIKVMNIGN